MRGRGDGRVRHCGATILCASQRTASLLSHIHANDRKSSRKFRLADLRSPNCQSRYGLGRLPGLTVMLSSTVIGQFETEHLEGTPCEA